MSSKLVHVWNEYTASPTPAKCSVPFCTLSSACVGRTVARKWVLKGRQGGVSHTIKGKHPVGRAYPLCHQRRSSSRFHHHSRSWPPAKGSAWLEIGVAGNLGLLWFLHLRNEDGEIISAHLFLDLATWGHIHYLLRANALMNFCLQYVLCCITFFFFTPWTIWLLYKTLGTVVLLKHFMAILFYLWSNNVLRINNVIFNLIVSSVNSDLLYCTFFRSSLLFGAKKKLVH